MEPFTSEPCGAVKCVVHNRNEGYCSINIELTTLNSKLVSNIKFQVYMCLCVFAFVLFAFICSYLLVLHYYALFMLLVTSVKLIICSCLYLLGSFH